MTPQRRPRSRKRSKKVREALKGEDLEAIKTAVESLNTKVGAVSEELYKAAAASAQAQPGAADGPTPEKADFTKPGEPKDDVVDADFEMVDKDDKKKGQKMSEKAADQLELKDASAEASQEEPTLKTYQIVTKDKSFSVKAGSLAWTENGEFILLMEGETAKHVIVADNVIAVTEGLILTPSSRVFSGSAVAALSERRSAVRDRRYN